MTKTSLPVTCSLLYLSWTMLLAPTCSQNAPAQTCDPGWFGSNCRYKCRCRRSNCGRDGTCADGFCARGWFGPECQYVDLSYNHYTPFQIQPLYDGDAATCVQDQGLTETIVIMLSEFRFTWLRLQVNDTSLLHAFQVTFISGQGTNTSCSNMRNAIFDKTTLDIRCDVHVSVRIVILTGDGVKSLCSVYVSGGRNVALRQKATQSSAYYNSTAGETEHISLATNAVDGNRNNTFGGKSCTHTLHNDLNPSWTVTLSSAYIINRYVVYNRNVLPIRLSGFTLRSFSRGHRTVFSYTDTEPRPLNVYTITNIEINTPVSVVNIRANKKIGNETILTLCEVELYGDTACPPLKYGRECEHTCNCAVKDVSCFVSTGGCPSGCAAGFQGENCDKSCDLGTYGLGCSSSCSQFCVATTSSRSPCFPTNGTCVHGCVSGNWSSNPKCEHIPEANDNDSTPVAVVVYPLIAVVVLVVVVVLGIILWRKRRAASLQQSRNVVNDHSRYDRMEGTELGKPGTSESVEPKYEPPVNLPTTSNKQIYQNCVFQNEDLGNVDTGDRFYEEFDNTKWNQISTEARTETRPKPAVKPKKSTTKQTSQNSVAQNNTDDTVYNNQ